MNPRPPIPNPLHSPRNPTNLLSLQIPNRILALLHQLRDHSADLFHRDVIGLIAVIQTAVQGVGDVVVSVLDGFGEIEDHFGVPGFADPQWRGSAGYLHLAADEAEEGEVLEGGPVVVALAGGGGGHGCFGG